MSDVSIIGEDIQESVEIQNRIATRLLAMSILAIEVCCIVWLIEPTVAVS